MDCSLKDISSLPAWSDFDSTTELCGLFTSTPDMTKPAKLPKLERIEMTCLGRPASLMTHDMQVLMQDSVTQSCLKRTVLKQAARGCGRGRRNNRVDPTEPRIPKTYEMVFRPFNNMGLSLQECKLTAYIFGKELPLDSDVISGRSCLSIHSSTCHKRFSCHCPPPPPPHTPCLDARKSKTPRAWYLPTNFATDVLLDTPVYVPVWEAIDMCYMLLLDVKAARLYVLDVSRSPESIVRREANMQRIYPGAINAVDSNETSTWLLYWLQQDWGFSTQIFSPMIHLEAVRMRTATSIVSCDANEHACFIHVKAELLWHDLMDCTE
ncbi:hypothetical protein AHAS_Ahas20G0037100 [Arachis hypogaea]